jgi:uncharacterized protein
LRTRWLVLLALAGWTAAAQGLELPDRPTARINDYADALPAAARQRLEEQLRGYTTGQSYQVAVALFRSLEGESLEDVSIRLAEKWRIGSRKDDGVLMTVFLAEHRLRIEVGYGLEDRLPDARASRIIREVITPRFRAGDLEGGLRDGLAAIHAAVTGQAAPPSQPQEGKAPRAAIGGVLLFALILFVMAMVAIARRRRPPGDRGGWSAGSRGWWGPAMWLGSGMSSWSSSSSSDGGGFGGFGGFGGGGGDGGGGGGGFSGGGGSFGGGGASGSW